MLKLSVKDIAKLQSKTEVGFLTTDMKDPIIPVS